jgi:hypothetical protein
MKTSMKPSGIELATFQLVALCLDQLRHRVPPKVKDNLEYFDSLKRRNIRNKIRVKLGGGGGGGTCRRHGQIS